MSAQPATRSAVVLRHLAFEDLDALEPLLGARGFSVLYVDTPTQTDYHAAALAADLLVVLGGPIGVGQHDDYPFLILEIEIVRQRLQTGKAVLGICLGAQIMAAALGARVYPGPAGKEIGWKPLQLTAAGRQSPLAALGGGQAVLHWHGDTFDLPQGAVLLASTTQYPHQAFGYGTHGLALQFHIEASPVGLERWYVGHTGELAQAGLGIPELRRAARVFAPEANAALEQLLDHYLGAGR